MYPLPLFQGINKTMKHLTYGDIAVILPLAWVISQSILYGGIFWGIVAFVIFNQYAARRSTWDE